MSLSSTEKLVLQTVLLQARHTVDQIAKQAGLRSHVVRRAVANLEEQKVLLGVRAYVNPYPLGFQVYQVLFSMPRASAQQHQDLVAAICAREGVGLLSELSGDPQYEMHILARDSQDVVALLDSLQQTAPDMQLGNLSMVHEQLYSGALGHLMRDSKTFKPLRYGATGGAASVDALDHALLCLLANESIGSHRELSQRLECPVNTISYRVHKLEERGLIAGYYYLCDFKPLGVLPVVGLLQSSVLNAEARARLSAFCNRHPVIAYVDFTVGAFAARVFMRAASYEEARQVMHELREAFAETVHSIRVMPQLRFMRHSTYPFSAKRVLADAR